MQRNNDDKGKEDISHEQNERQPLINPNPLPVKLDKTPLYCKLEELEPGDLVVFSDRASHPASIPEQVKSERQETS